MNFLVEDLPFKGVEYQSSQRCERSRALIAMKAVASLRPFNNAALMNFDKGYWLA